MRKLLILLPLAFALAACGASGPAVQPTAAPAQAPTSAPQPSPSAATPTAPTAPSPQPGQPYPAPGQPYPAPGDPAQIDPNVPADLIQAAQSRLANQLGIAADRLTIQRAQGQEWPDTSIGCPDPSATYENARVPGYLLVFSDGQVFYSVHTSLAATPGEPMVLCQDSRPIDIAAQAQPPVLDATGNQMVELAKQDLAKLLGIDPSAVTLVSASPVEWNDSSLGCPKPDVAYMQVITPGFLIRISAQGSTYEYHTDSRSQVVKCVP